MTKLIFILIFFNSCNNIVTNNYKDYIGKEVNQMLSDSKYSNYTEYQFFDLKPRVLSGIRLIYKDKTIELYISEFNHTKSYNIEGSWEFKNVIKEKISRIIVYDDKESIMYDSSKN